MKRQRVLCLFLALCMCLALISGTGTPKVHAATINEVKVVTDFASYLEAVAGALTLPDAATAYNKTTTVKLANDIVIETAEQASQLFYSRAFGVDPTSSLKYYLAGFNSGYHRNSKMTLKFAPPDGSDIRPSLKVADSLLITAPTTVQVGSFPELCTAIARAQYTVLATGERNPRLTIEFTNDISITALNQAAVWSNFGDEHSGLVLGYVFILDSVDLHLTSANGQIYTLKNTSRTDGFTFRSSGNCYIGIDHLILDGGTYGNAIKAHESSIYIGEGAKVCNFNTTYSAPVSCSMGSVIIDGGEISNNHGVGSAMAGAGGVSLSGSTLTMNSGRICNNSATSSFGGAVSMYAVGRRNPDGTTTTTPSVFTMNGGEISGNLAKGAGGVYVNNSIFYMNGGEIIENQAKQTDNTLVGNSEGGGGLYLRANSTATITAGKINNNYTDLSGGGVLVFNGSHLVMTGGEICGNIADAHAGAVDICDDFSMSNDTGRSSATLSNTLIANNTANSLYSDSTEEHSSDCFASGGGAFHVHEDCTLKLETGTVVRNNQTLNGGDGGAIYVSHTGKLSLDNDSLQYNTASGNGGAIYIEGTGKYSGNVLGGGEYDGYGAGVMMDLSFCIISHNTAVNGGAIYVGGNNMVDEQEYYGAICNIEGGIITQNTATGKGGGVYVESAPSGEYGGIFKMTSGALYYNTAGANGNGSTGLNEAGADLYSEGGNARITVPTAKEITHYLQDPGSPYVPEQDKTTWFTNWYDDYSDQDPEYGKSPEKIGTGVNTGRFTTSTIVDRMVYEPVLQDQDRLALILAQSTELEINQSVSGENVVEGEKFPIEIVLTETDDTLGSLYPVEYTLHRDGTPSRRSSPHPLSENIVVINGKEYLDFGEESKVLIHLQDAESLTIRDLPIGTQFKVEQISLMSSVSSSASGENCLELEVGSGKASGATNTDWRDEDGFTLSIVNLVNDYTPLAPTEPSAPGEAEPTEDPTEPSEPSESTDSTEPTAPQLPPQAPGTGDSFALPLFIASFFVSGLVLLAVIFLKKRSAKFDA